MLDIWGKPLLPLLSTYMESRGCSKPGSRAGWPPQSLGPGSGSGPRPRSSGMLEVRLLRSEPSQSAENTPEGGKHHGRAAESTAASLRCFRNLGVKVLWTVFREKTKCRLNG